MSFLTGAGSGLRIARVSPSGNFLAGFEDRKSRNAQLTIWDLRNGRIIDAIESSENRTPLSIAWSADESMIALVTTDCDDYDSRYCSNITFLWDRRAERRLFEYIDVGEKVSFAPAGDYLLTHSENLQRIDFWPLQTDQLMPLLRQYAARQGLNQEIIADFELDDGFLLDVDGNIRQMHAQEKAPFIEAWGSFFLNKSIRSPVIEDKQRYLEITSQILLQNRNFTYSDRSPLFSLLRQYHMECGEYWLDLAANPDSARYHLRKAIELGGTLDF